MIEQVVGCRIQLRRIYRRSLLPISDASARIKWADAAASPVCGAAAFPASVRAARGPLWELDVTLKKRTS
jgi:hypothetical protein